jgi:hypothetical protein
VKINCRGESLALPFKKIKMKRLLILSVLMVVVMTACHNKADLSVPPPFPSQSPWLSCSKDTIFFNNSVLPIFINSCAVAGCHDANTGQEDLVLDNYSTIRANVVPGDPASSKLYKVLFSYGEKKMPPKSTLSVNQKGLIYYWILQGALDNECPTPCDSTHVTYDSAIVIITQSWCTSCHSGSTPAYGLSLATYDEVKASVNSGRLMGAIRQQSGYYPMPKGGQLSPCDIAIFQKWINLGMPK